MEQLDPVATLRFLVVDDDNALRKVVVHALKQIGVMRLTEANDGTLAWKFLEDSIGKPQYDIVVSDWKMPSLSGLELLKRCRSHPEFKEIGFLLITSESDVNQVKQAIEAGVDNYIVKPVKTESFREKLNQLYKKKFASRA